MINGYFPQGESRDHETKFPAKAAFYQNLQNYLETELKRDNPVLIMGDRILAQPIWISALAKRTVNAGCVPENVPSCRRSVNRMERLLGSGWWIPTVTQILKRMTSSRGLITAQKALTITVACVSIVAGEQPMAERCEETDIDYEIRSMEKPSDHAPYGLNSAANLAALLAQTGSGELTLRKINKLSVMICCLPSFVIPSLRF
ncbi:hypothetical protein ACNKHK_09395 [Shigella flexneri]